jgi:hypothetical protein
MSRNASSDPAGKLTARLDIPVSESLKESLSALAIVSGYGSTGEYLRAVLTAHVHGHLATAQAAYRRSGPAAMGRKDGE